MNERHRVYLRKAAKQPPPWTDDPILQKYKFTNVYRELDAVTVWIRKNWREPYANHQNLWFAMCIARQINWPDTLEEIGFPTYKWNPVKAAEIMEAMKDLGLKVYTGAYMIRADSGEWRSKAEYLCTKVLGEVWEARADIVPVLTNSNSIEASTECLSQFYGWGGFMAYEVVTDLRWTRYLRNATDIMTWANPGPGCCHGLNAIFGRDRNSKPPKKLLLKEMRYLLKESKKYLERFMPPLEMRDIEHSCCEFDKYWRTKTGVSRPKSLYPGK